MGKIYDGIMGLVVGDALGVPFEFKKRDTFKADKMTGHGTYNQPPGTWSDDSSLTLATLESIGRLGRVDPADIMENFHEWLYKSKFTPDERVFDVGATTKQAIRRYDLGFPLEKCGGNSEMENGNGSLMRILPIAMMDFPDIKDKLDLIKQVGSLTHSHRKSIIYCYVYTTIVDLMMYETKNIYSAIFNGYKAIKDSYGRWCEMNDRIPDLIRLNRDEIRSSGYVVDTLEAALWCLLKTSTYEDCVLTAVNLGEDTDTVAAVAGGLAGIVYGCGGKSGIPTRWINQIARKEWIQMLCDNFESKFSK